VPATTVPATPEPEVLRFVIVPEETEALDREHWGPLVEYVAEQVGMTAELIIATDYSAVTEAMKYGHADIATFGAFGYILAADEADIEIIVGEISGETGRPYNYAYVFVRLDSGITSVAELDGETFAFVSESSTTGFLFPSYAFLEADAEPGKILYSGGHPQSVAAVANGSVVGAGTSEYRVRAAIEGEIITGAWSVSDFALSDEWPVYEEGVTEVGKDDLLLIWESPPMPPTNWAVRSDMDQELKMALRVAFESIPEEVIWKPGVAGFVPMVDSDFNFLRDVKTEVGLD